MGDDDPSFASTAIFTALSAVSILISYADRSNLATAILPMSEQYDWSKSFQGIVLSSFFLGYALTQVVGGWLADKYGGRLTLVAGLTAWSVFTIITPFAAEAGTLPLLAARVGLGLGEGFAFPSVHAMISKVIPSTQQSTVVAIVTAASYGGAFVAFGASPYIIEHFGWPYVFYTFGGVSCLLAPAWLLYKPRTLSDGGASGGDDETGGPLLEGKEAPEASELTPTLLADMKRLGARREVWAILAAQFTQSAGMYGLLNWLPTYLSDEYHVPVGELGAFTVAPYALQGLVGVGAGALADGLIAREWSVKAVRQWLQAIGMIGPALFLLLATAVADSVESGAALLTVGTGFSALTLGAVSVNHLDIAPRSAGLVFGAGNTAATLAGLIIVPLSGWLLDNFHSWDLVFKVFAGNYILGCVLWVLWVGDKRID